MPSTNEMIHLGIEASRERVVESLADAMTHEQTIEAIMAMDEHMADMDASITVVDKLLESLRDEVKAGEGSEGALARFDALHSELVELLKAGKEN